LFISQYASYISYICSSTCTFSFFLHLFNSSANNFWIWYICLFISLWITICSLFTILYTSPLIGFLYISLNYNKLVLILINLIFATVASLTRFWTCSCISTILSNPLLSTYLEITSLWWYCLLIMQACLPQWPSFSQHVLWQCCNHLGILSFMVEILLFDSVFYNKVTSVSVSTLKLLLGVIKALLLKLWASPIISIYI